MDELLTMPLKKKILIAVMVLVFIAVAILCVILFSPDPMPVDWNTIKKIPSNVELLNKDDEHNTTGSVALVRYLDKEKTVIDTSDWKVLQFTDMHLTQNDETNDTSITLFIRALQREKPDFVVLTGDIITRPRGRERAVQLAQIFEKMGIYWCACLGNHEGDSSPYTLSREENVRIWSGYPHCLMENDVKKTEDGTEVWGLGNTVVNLLGADYEVVQSLICLDSGNEISDEDAAKYGAPKQTYDFLKDSQITWYEEQVRKVTKDLTNRTKVMLFIHIPLVEQSYADFLRAKEPLPEGWYYADQDPLYVNGELMGRMIVMEGWNIIGDTASYEYAHCSKYNSGMYDKMKSLRSHVNGLFCGHDHINDTVIYEDYDSETQSPIYLCYGIASGLQSYNLYDEGLSEEDDYHLRGYAAIEISCEEHFGQFSFYTIRYTDEEVRVPRIVYGVAQ